MPRSSNVLLCTAALSGFLFISLFAGSAAAQQQKFFTIGTGGVTGVYYSVGGAICQLVNKQRRAHGLRCSVEATPASLHNLNAIRKGDLDLGLAQSDAEHAAFLGGDSFRAAGPDPNLRALFSLHMELVTVAVRKDSRITQFEELRGKRVNVGPPGAGTKYSAEKLMQSYDMKDSDFAELLALKPDEQGDALCKGRIDAFIYIVGHPARNIADTASACPITLLQLTGAKVARLARTTPSYAQATIPAKSYAGQNEAVQTYGIRAVLLASSDTSDKVAYEVARAVFGNFTEFTALHPAFGGLDPATMVKTGFSAPLHPGALKYYKEKGMLK